MHVWRPYGKNLSSAGNPILEPNITSIGKPVAKLWPFLYIQIYKKYTKFSRHRGFYQTGNIAPFDPSADPEKPGLEPNMEWIGCIVCEIFAFELYGDLETGFRGHSRPSKVALFDGAHTTLYSSSICLYLWRFQRWSSILVENRYPLVFGAPVRGDAVRFTERPLVTKNYNHGPIRSWQNFDDTFSCFDIKYVCDRRTDRQTDRLTELPWHIIRARALPRVKRKEKENGKAECRRNPVWNYIRIIKRTLKNYFMPYRYILLKFHRQVPAPGPNFSVAGHRTCQDRAWRRPW